MAIKVGGPARRYRVWIVRYYQRAPNSLCEVPAEAVAMEPAESGAMSKRRARQYVEAFNHAALGGTRKVWAVMTPVVLRYDNDLQPGTIVPVSRATNPEQARNPGDSSPSADCSVTGSR